MAVDMLADFAAGVRNSKTGGIITTASELRENQFGIPLKHYAQQYLFGATGLRIQVFNSIQGQKEVGKSTMLFDLIGDSCASFEDGGLEGIAVLYELEGKISPTILWSILSNHGQRAQEACFVRLGMTLEEAMKDLNRTIIPQYMASFPKLDRPLIIGFDSIGGAASKDTIEKIKVDGVAGKGYYDKQHYMKYFCENQGMIFAQNRIPVVIICINQEREQASTVPGRNIPMKVITGGKAQLFKDGHMISASKKPLSAGDGNIVYLKTTKTSYCDPRSIEVEFRWNKFGVKKEDAYEARFLWELASATCLAEPEHGARELKKICEVTISERNLVTCPQLGLRSVPPEEFEPVLMDNKEILEQLYIHQKIEKLKDLNAYSEYVASLPSPKAVAKKDEAPDEEPKEEKPKAKSKAKSKSKKTEEPQLALSLDAITAEEPEVNPEDL